mgnify:CR=1 FL=1
MKLSLCREVDLSQEEVVLLEDVDQRVDQGWKVSLMDREVNSVVRGADVMDRIDIQEDQETDFPGTARRVEIHLCTLIRETGRVRL